MKKWWNAVDEHFFRKPSGHELDLLENYDYERSIRHLLERLLKDRTFINYENIMSETNLIYVILKI